MMIGVKRSRLAAVHPDLCDTREPKISVLDLGMEPSGKGDSQTGAGYETKTKRGKCGTQIRYSH